MKLWKRLCRYLKSQEKWIEIKLPEYFKKNDEDNLLKNKEENMLNDEESVIQRLDMEGEEE